MKTPLGAAPGMLLAIGLLLAACSESAGDAAAERPRTDAGTLGTTETHAWVVAHNAVRAGIVTTPPLKPLVWSEELADVAKNAAIGCAFEHTAVPYGENVFAGNVAALTEKFVVDAWAVEASGYDIATDACSKPPCGHYKQLVWRTSERVGCAIAACSGAFKQIAFCMYDPPGGYTGEKPY